jgi:hypothetical protein
MKLPQAAANGNQVAISEFVNMVWAKVFVTGEITENVAVLLEVKKETGLFDLFITGQGHGVLGFPLRANCWLVKSSTDRQFDFSGTNVAAAHANILAFRGVKSREKVASQLTASR